MSILQDDLSSAYYSVCFVQSQSQSQSVTVRQSLPPPRPVPSLVWWREATGRVSPGRGTQSSSQSVSQSGLRARSERTVRSDEFLRLRTERQLHSQNMNCGRLGNNNNISRKNKHESSPSNLSLGFKEYKR